MRTGRYLRIALLLGLVTTPALAQKTFDNFGTSQSTPRPDPEAARRAAAAAAAERQRQEAEAQAQAQAQAQRQALEAQRAQVEREKASRAAAARQQQEDAARQTAIATKARQTSQSVDRDTRTINDQLDKAEPEAAERFLPIGLAVLAALVVAALAWRGAARRRVAARRREDEAQALAERELEVIEQAGRDVALSSPDGGLKLPGPALREGLVLGRSPDRAHVILPKEEVGRVHARFEWQGDQLIVTDLGSKNGTFINGERLGPDQPQPLRDGDQLGLTELYEFTVEFQ